MSITSQKSRFWRLDSLDDLELNYASYGIQEFPRHFHEEYVIGVTERGLERVSCGGTTYLASPGTLHLLNPGQPCASSSFDEAGITLRTFYPSMGLMRAVLTELTGRDRGAPIFPEPIVTPQSSHVADCLKQLHLSLAQPAPRLEQESRFTLVMAKLLRAHAQNRLTERRARREPTKARLVRDFLEAHYAEKISLTHLGSLVNLSTFHLLRIFRDEFGLPPYEYQNQVRLARAKTLLRQGAAIARVASETGYADQSHMTRQFRRFLGITPRQYANSNIVQDR